VRSRIIKIEVSFVEKQLLLAKKQQFRSVDRQFKFETFLSSSISGKDPHNETWHK